MVAIIKQTLGLFGGSWGAEGELEGLYCYLSSVNYDLYF